MRTNVQIFASNVPGLTEQAIKYYIGLLSADITKHSLCRSHGAFIYSERAGPYL